MTLSCFPGALGNDDEPKARLFARRRTDCNGRHEESVGEVLPGPNARCCCTTTWRIRTGSLVGQTAESGRRLHDADKPARQTLRGRSRFWPKIGIASQESRMQASSASAPRSPSRMLKKAPGDRYAWKQIRVLMFQYARPRHSTKHDVQLPLAGTASPGGSPPAADSANGGRCAEGAVSFVR